MLTVFCQVSLLLSTEKDGYHTWKWLLSARSSSVFCSLSEEGATFLNIKIQMMGKELFADFGRSRAPLKGWGWGGGVAAFNYFKFFSSPIGLWSLQDGRCLSSNTAVCCLIYTFPPELDGFVASPFGAKSNLPVYHEFPEEQTATPLSYIICAFL